MTLKRVEDLDAERDAEKIETLRARLAKVQAERDAARRIIDGQMKSEVKQHARPKHPSGWEPSVETEGNRAVAVSEPTEDPNPDEDWLIAGWKLDPKVWRIVGDVNVRRWQAMRAAEFGNELVWMHYYRANLERIDPKVHADVDALYKRIRGYKKQPKQRTGDLTYLVLIGDTQIGKGDGDGSQGTIGRWLYSLQKTVEQFHRLVKSGVEIGEIVLAFMGDMGESCTGNYAAQQFTTDLTMREQDGILQELIFDTLAQLAPLCTKMTVVVVPGNHGEQRIDGKAFTLPSDNRDIACVETVHRGIRRNENKAFDHVKFVYPDSQELTVTMDLSGIPTAFAHGHQFTRGGSPALKAENWWKDASHGMTAAGDARLLFSGHYHHLIVNPNGKKTHIQIPALDGGSVWWENLKSQSSAPGMVSLVVGEGIGPAMCGWDDLKVS